MNLARKKLEKALATFRREAETEYKDSKANNRSYYRMEKAFRILRATQEGRAMVSALMKDDNPDVRSSAACRCMEWNPETARAVLEAIIKDDPNGLGFGAKMFLSEYDKGKITFDY